MRKVLARLAFLGLLGGAAFSVVRKRGGAGEVWHQANDIADESAPTVVLPPAPDLAPSD